MLKAIIVAVGISAANLAWAQASPCKKPPNEIYLIETFQFTVAGTGRLHFHTGPHESCIDKKLFVIPGDELLAHSIADETERWVSVNFTTKRGKEVSGWVRSERLKFTGAIGGNISESKQKYFKKAVAAANAGKLGMP